MSQRGMEVITGTIKYLLLGFAVTAAVILLFAAALWTTELPEGNGSIYAMIGCGAGCAVCGLGGGRLMKRRGIFWGVAYGALFLIIFLMVLFGATAGLVFPTVLQPGFLPCLLAAGLCGIVGVNVQKG